MDGWVGVGFFGYFMEGGRALVVFGWSGGEDGFSLWCRRVVESGVVRGDGEEIVYFWGAQGCGEYECSAVFALIVFFFFFLTKGGFTFFGGGDLFGNWKRGTVAN